MLTLCLHDNTILTWC